MDDYRAKRTNAKIMWGCSFFLLAALLAGAAVAIVALGRDRNIVHYPGASVVTNHSNYRGFPRQIRWDNSYFTTDNFTDVYQWYSTTFDLGAEARAIERCILLEGSNDQFIIVRHLSILLCNTPEGQLIYATRTTRLKTGGR